MAGLSILPIKEMKPMMRGFNCECIILYKDPNPTVTRNQDTIWKFTVADNTAAVTMLLWTEEGAYLRTGDIVRITNGVCPTICFLPSPVLTIYREAKVFSDEMHLTPARSGKIRRIGEDTMLFVEQPNMSQMEWVPNPRGGPMVTPLALAQQQQQQQQQQPQNPVQPTRGRPTSHHPAGLPSQKHQQRPIDPAAHPAPNPRDPRIRAGAGAIGAIPGPSTLPPTPRGGRGRRGGYQGSRRGSSHFQHHDFDRPGDSSRAKQLAQHPQEEFDAMLGIGNQRLKRQQVPMEQDTGLQKRHRIEYGSSLE
ncbi:hypothetical protein BC938DRAFT_476672 [Jimgerdemannia flammicorona]|uniref:OB domain-containing protein n=1 Tax=Jimgerdemannia flammicorona TaxID=994334 RepID=A0A433PFA1_9FUNG|nr:hypothetical protein BC938DRAFT_476672 [Jimgerdemannia flammicorona]